MQSAISELCTETQNILIHELKQHRKTDSLNFTLEMIICLKHSIESTKRCDCYVCTKRHIKSHQVHKFVLVPSAVRFALFVAFLLIDGSECGSLTASSTTSRTHS